MTAHQNRVRLARLRVDDAYYRTRSCQGFKCYPVRSRQDGHRTRLRYVV